MGIDAVLENDIGITHGRRALKPNERQIKAEPNLKEQIPVDITACTLTMVALCERCALVQKLNTTEISQRVLEASKCMQCHGPLCLSDEMINFITVLGYYVSEQVVVDMVLKTHRMKHEIVPYYVASVANMVMGQFQTSFTYDVAIPRSKQGLGLKLKRSENDVQIEGFAEQKDGDEGPAQLTKMISPGDSIIGINKDSIEGLTFEQKTHLLYTCKSPLYLTFLRRTPVRICTAAPLDNNAQSSPMNAKSNGQTYFI